MTKKVKWVRKWFWGYDKKSEKFADEDWVTCYESEVGTIEVKPYDNYHNEYVVEKDGYEYWFARLAKAKEFLIEGTKTYVWKEPIARNDKKMKLHLTINDR